MIVLIAVAVAYGFLLGYKIPVLSRWHDVVMGMLFVLGIGLSHQHERVWEPIACGLVAYAVGFFLACWQGRRDFR